MASAAELAIILSVKDLASKELSGFGKQLGGMGTLGKVATAGLAAVGAAGVGLTAGLVKSIGAAMDFEAAMSAVQAVAGGSEADLKALSDAAIQLGQDTTLSGIGATEAAQAMRELAAAGLSVEDIVGGGALGALRLASAGGIDVARAAEIAAMALANFGLEGNQAAMVADLFASAANSSAISVDDIAESLKYVGPIANSMGLSIEEVTATIAALGNQGIKASSAGTALRSMLVNLASPSKEAKKIINGLGLEFFDTTGKMKSLADVSEELKAGMAGLTDQQRAHALSTIFGNEALTAATVLYGEGAAGINKWLNEIQNGATAAQVGAMRNDNLKGSIEALKGSFETAQIVLGRAFLPALKQLVDLATQAVNASIPLLEAWGPRFATAIAAGLGALPAIATRASAAIGGIVAAFRALAAGDINGMFGPILAAIEAAFGPDAMARAAGGVSTFLTVLDQLRGMLGQAREAIAGLPTPVQQLIAGFLAFGPAVRVAAVALPLLLGAFTGLGPIVGLLTSTIPVLGGIIAALGGPLTLAVVAVGALGVAWATNFMGIRDTTMPIVAQIGALITGTLLPSLQQVVPALQQLGATVTAAVLPPLTQFGTWILAVFVPAVQQMGAAALAAFQAALPGIMAFVAGAQQLGSVVLPIVAALASAIMGTLGPAVQAIGDWATEVVPQFSAAWVNVASIVGPLIGALAGLVGNGLAMIAGFIETHSAQIQGILEGTWQAMSNTIGAILTVITGLISTGLLVIAGDWEGAWARIQQTVTTAWGQIQAALAGGIQALVGIMSVGLSNLVAAMGAAWDAMQSATSAAWEAIKATVSNGVNAIPGIVRGIIGAAGAAARAIGQAIIDGIAGALSAGAGRLASIASDVVNGALEAAKSALGIRSPSKEFAEIGRQTVLGFVRGITRNAHLADAAVAAALSPLAITAPAGVGGGAAGGGAGGAGGGNVTNVSVNNPVVLSRDSITASALANIVSGAQSKAIGYSI